MALTTKFYSFNFNSSGAGTYVFSSTWSSSLNLLAYSAGASKFFSRYNKYPSYGAGVPNFYTNGISAWFPGLVAFSVTSSLPAFPIYAVSFTPLFNNILLNLNSTIYTVPSGRVAKILFNPDISYSVYYSATNTKSFSQSAVGGPGWQTAVSGLATTGIYQGVYEGIWNSYSVPFNMNIGPTGMPAYAINSSNIIQSATTVPADLSNSYVPIVSDGWWDMPFTPSASSQFPFPYTRLVSGAVSSFSYNNTTGSAAFNYSGYPKQAASNVPLNPQGKDFIYLGPGQTFNINAAMSMIDSIGYVQNGCGPSTSSGVSAALSTYGATGAGSVSTYSTVISGSASYSYGFSLSGSFVVIEEASS